MSTTPQQPSAAPSHVEEIALGIADAVRTLMLAGNLRKIETQTPHSMIQVYFVNEIIRIDVRPRA